MQEGFGVVRYVSVALPLCFRRVPVAFPLEMSLDFRYIFVRFNDNNLADQSRSINKVYVC